MATFKRVISAVLVFVTVLCACPVMAVSAAEEEVHDYKVGDVNHDEKINAKDATLILQLTVGILSEDVAFCDICAETSGDGKINAKDATMTLQFSVGNIEEFPDPLVQNINLTMSVAECAVGYNEVIYVYAAMDGIAENVYLIDSATNETVLTLMDDGLYSVSGDDLPNDNIYSGKLELDTSEAKDYSYYVTAKGVGTVTSNTASVRVVGGFTEEQLDQMELADTTLQDSIFGAENFDDMSIEERKNLAEEAMASLCEQGLIDEETVEYDEDSAIYTFTYESGVLGIIVLEEWQENQDGIQMMDGGVEELDAEEEPAEDVQVEVEVESVETAETTSESTEEALTRGELWELRKAGLLAGGTAATFNTGANEDKVAQIGEAIVLWSFNQVWDKSTFRVPFYEQMEAEFDARGLETTVDWDVTVDDYKKLAGNEVIMFSGHGVYWKYKAKVSFGKTETKWLPSLVLTEKATKYKDKSYEADLKEFRVGKVQVEGGTMYAILPNFFLHYYDEGDLDGSFVFIQDCESHGKNGNENFQFSSALLAASAETVIGYHNSVESNYGRNLMKTYIENLIDGQTAIEAYNGAVSVHGGNDGRIAYPLFRGNESSRLISDGLKNGNFEQGSTPVSWSQVGDTRILTKLGPLDPTSGKRMAILTTGIGSAEKDYMAGTEGSVLSQQFRIPEDATKLTFAYNVVSEEPMEWVNSSYDDAFFANLITQEGTVELASERINTSTWYEIEQGIDFEGGDATTYHTMWKNVEYDVSAYAGQIVTIQFIVYDVGDSAWDTAALIDNVKVK